MAMSFGVFLSLSLKIPREYLKLGHAVAQLVEELLYKPEGRGFDSRWCHWNFSVT
jgi:hypothetical protein